MNPLSPSESEWSGSDDQQPAAGLNGHGSSLQTQLLEQLGAEYPEVSAAVMFHALAQAAVAAEALGGDTRTVVSMARDRLEVIRVRTATARRTGAALPQEQSVARGGGDAPRPACTYCRGPVPIGAFRYRSTARRLMVAQCLTCEREMTVLTITWLRWNRALADRPDR